VCIPSKVEVDPLLGPSVALQMLFSSIKTRKMVRGE
jgi:hypothetical protein